MPRGKKEKTLKAHHVADEAVEASEGFWVRRKLTEEAKWGRGVGVGVWCFWDTVEPFLRCHGANSVKPQ